MKIDFFVVGAPKCGTTSLMTYLATHPEIGVATIKEPFFFNTKTPGFQGVKTWDQYLSLYKGMDDKKVRGEGTTWYLYSKEAVSNILEYNEHAKFVVCLRNPAEAVIAWHNQAMLVGAENEPDFQKAWDNQEARMSANTTVPVYGDPKMLKYSEAYKLGDQLERIKAAVKPENLHTIFMDDMKTNARQVYLDLLSFLNVEDDGRDEFPIAYARAATKSSIGRKLASNMSYYQRISLTRAMQSVGLDIHNLYLKCNTKKADRGAAAEMNPDFIAFLQEYFLSQVEKLEQLTERDLQTWKTRPITTRSSASSAT